MHEALDIKNYLSEANVAADSPILGKTVADLFNLAKGSVAVTSILRGSVRLAPLPDATLKEGDTLLIEGDHAALDALVAQARLSVTGDRPAPEGESVDSVEAVIGAGSSLIGWSAQALGLFDRLDVNLLAISRKGAAPQRPAGHDPAGTRRRHHRPGRPRHPAGAPPRPRLPAARGAADPPRQRPARAGAGPDSRRRGGRNRDRRRPGRRRLLRGSRGHDPVRRGPDPGSLYRARRPDPGDARRSHPGQRIAPAHRRHRRDRRGARRSRRDAAALWALSR